MSTKSEWEYIKTKPIDQQFSFLENLFSVRVSRLSDSEYENNQSIKDISDLVSLGLSRTDEYYSKLVNFLEL